MRSPDPETLDVLAHLFHMSPDEATLELQLPGSLPLPSAGEAIGALTEARAAGDALAVARVLWSAALHDGLAWRRVERVARRSLVRLALGRVMAPPLELAAK